MNSMNNQMSWVRYLRDAQPVDSIFSEPPPLVGVRLHEVRLHQDGPAASLRFDLNTYPDNPPQKWILNKFNRVQLTLALINVTRMSIQGWEANNIGRIVLAEHESGIRLAFTANETNIVCHAQFAELLKVSA